jgi:oligopeptide transport system substrate-binding protein
MNDKYEFTQGNLIMRFILTLCTISLLFGSCTRDKKLDDKHLHLISPSKVSGYDPIQASDMYSTNEIGKVYEGLYEFHPVKRPYELMPNLAENLPQVSEDGLTYTFKILQGVLFHDDPAFKDGVGRELKAADFIYSFKRLADPKLMSKGWWMFDDKIVGLNEWRQKPDYNANISGFNLIDDYTFSVTLKRPFPQFLYALVMPYGFVVAQEAVEYYGKEFLNHPVGTGPFILPQYTQSNKIIYTKNPKFREKYFPGKEKKERIPLVDKITVHVILEAQPRWLSFQKAKIDLLGIPKDNFDQAVDENFKLVPELSDKGVNLSWTPMLDVTFYAFNHEDPLFKNNPKLRQAMSMAYKRDESNKIFYNNTALVAQGIIPPGLGGHRKEFENPYVKYDLQKAKKLLAEAGYPEGKGLPQITLETTSETTSRQGAEFFAKSMADIGIKIKAGTNSWPELVNKVSKKQHQMYTMAWGADYPDAENFLSLLYCPNKSPGSNGSNYCNPKFDALFKKSTMMQESPERSALYQELNEWVSQEVPWILGFHRTNFYLNHSWLENFQIMEFNHTQFQYLGVDLKEKKKAIKKF